MNRFAMTLCLMLMVSGCVHGQSYRNDQGESWSAGAGEGTSPTDLAGAEFVSNQGRAQRDYMGAQSQLLRDFGTQYRNDPSLIRQAIIVENARPPRNEARIGQLRQALERELARRRPNRERLRQLREWLTAEENARDPEKIRVLQELLEQCESSGSASGAGPMNGGLQGGRLGQPLLTSGPQVDPLVTVQATASGAYLVDGPLPPAVPGLHRLGIYNAENVSLRFVVTSDTPGQDVHQQLQIPPGRYGIVLVPSGNYRINGYDRSDVNRRRTYMEVDDLQNNAQYEGITFDACWPRLACTLP